MQESEAAKNEISQKVGAMKSTNLVFVDTETTGLDPRRHELIELAYIRVNQSWIPGEKPVFEELYEWSVKVRPEHIVTADPVSLKVAGYSPDEWRTADDVLTALQEFSDGTQGAIMVAHNVAADAAFIDTALSTHGMQNKMHYHRLDTVSMAYAKLHGAPDVHRFSLAELCKYFGIINPDPHSALADARACFELFKKLMEL